MVNGSDGIRFLDEMVAGHAEAIDGHDGGRMSKTGIDLA
jgi:hypothetical protein